MAKLEKEVKGAVKKAAKGKSTGVGEKQGHLGQIGQERRQEAPAVVRF
jgi:hypothetical protein